jgi:hypothetical protein
VRERPQAGGSRGAAVLRLPRRAVPAAASAAQQLLLPHPSPALRAHAEPIPAAAHREVQRNDARPASLLLLFLRRDLGRAVDAVGVEAAARRQANVRASARCVMAPRARGLAMGFSASRKGSGRQQHPHVSAIGHTLALLRAAVLGRRSAAYMRCSVRGGASGGCGRGERADCSHATASHPEPARQLMTQRRSWRRCNRAARHAVPLQRGEQAANGRGRSGEGEEGRRWMSCATSARALLDRFPLAEAARPRAVGAALEPSSPPPPSLRSCPAPPINSSEPSKAPQLAICCCSPDVQPQRSACLVLQISSRRAACWRRSSAR